jgi:signal recognition particle receptor subunit beta
MVLINKAINEVTVKLVYYGPGLCGKTTNLEKIYGNPKLEHKGKMISMATETDRTLFFDFMPMELGTVAGQKVRVQLYTVPGQVFYDATRKLVLRGTDGVVFVADSQPSMRESNIASLGNLKTNLRLNRIDPEKVALVFQYNKRDLPAVSTVDEMSEYLQPGDAPVVEAAAIQGLGVTATLRAAVTRILENLKKNVDISLPDAPELAAPDMTAKAGVTPTSASTSRLSMRSTMAGGGTASAAEPSPMPAPEPVGGTNQGARSFGEAESGNPFGDAEPFDSTATDDSEFDNPFATHAAQRPIPSASGDAEELLASARRLIVLLEESLEAARKHERELMARLQNS